MCDNIEKKILTDVHTHSAFSADGKSTIEEMLRAAEKSGISYYGISEHFDYDYKVNNLRFANNSDPIYTDPDKYFPRARELKEAYKDKMQVLVGGEFGYTDNEAAFPLYLELVKKYHPDFVVNSVHTQGKYDYSRQEVYYPNGKSSVGNTPRKKSDAYKEYFSLVKKSLDVPYPYDIIGHFTYCARYAPYADARASYNEFSKEIDEILYGIIERGKILEANSSTRGAPSDFLPAYDIIKRYYDLGGRKISFASDAHHISGIAKSREKVVAALKEIGFGYITVPCRGEYIKVEL